ncbi:MAG TPA: ferredoxin, partial [Aquificae bacterium]|nr:ferredoxin [Aquificota bacterium]
MWELGAVIPYPGDSEEYKTGNWRTFKPILHTDKCINCMI